MDGRIKSQQYKHRGKCFFVNGIRKLSTQKQSWNLLKDYVA